MMKKHIYAAVALLLTVCLLSFVGVAAPVEQSVPTRLYSATAGDYEYAVLSDNTAEITDYTGSAVELILPERLGGYAVSVIGVEAFMRNSTLARVTIPGSVTTIAARAFYMCPVLEQVDFGSVREIGENAFNGCSLLSAAQLPDTLEIIGITAFNDCTALASITMPSSIVSVGFRAFYGTAWYNAQPNGMIYVGRVAYRYKGSVPADSTITLREGCVSVSWEAFYSQRGLVRLVLPSSLKVLGYAAFAYCSNLVTVEMASGLEQIERYAFYRCAALQSVRIPSSVNTIGECAFADITGLTIISTDGSAAQQYAEQNGIAFTAQAEIPTTTAAPTTTTATTAATTAAATTAAPTTAASTTAAPTTAAPTTAAATTGGAIVYGDVDGDGAVNAKDVLRLSQWLAQWEVTISADGADANVDGSINAKDLLLIRRFLAGYPVTPGERQ